MKAKPVESEAALQFLAPPAYRLLAKEEVEALNRRQRLELLLELVFERIPESEEAFRRRYRLTER